MRPRINLRAKYLSVLLLNFLHFIQHLKSQVTTSGQIPFDEPPTFVLSNFGYKSNEVSPQPPLTIEITVGDPATPGLDLTGFEYEVTWFAKDEAAMRKQTASQQLISNGNDITEQLGFSSTGNNGYKLGDEIYAKFRARYYRLDNVDSSIQDFGPWSQLVTAPTYKTGIVVSPDGDMAVKECDLNYTKITITLKTPVNCPTATRNCVLGIRIFLQRIPGTEFYWTSRQEIAFSSCQISLDNSHLNRPLDIYLKGICDPVDENNDKVFLRFEYTQSTYFWNTFSLPGKQINITDTSSRWCTYQGDPHMQTFDGLSYSYFGIGDFVLYKNQQLRLQIDVRLYPCANEGASCICGIAIRDVNDVLVLKGCNLNKPWLFGVTFRTTSPSSFSSIKVLRELSSNNKFYILLRSGAEVILTHTYNPEVEKGWVNTMVRVPDQGVHQGMCGNYDGILKNDLEHGGNGLNYTGDPSGFGESWSLAFDEDSWFKKIPVYTAITQRKMCSCGMRAGWWSESKPTLTTRCGFYEENYFLVINRTTEDITKSLRTNGRLRRNNDFSDLFEEETNDQGEFDRADFKEYKEIANVTWPTASGLNKSTVYDFCRNKIFGSSRAKECQNVIARRSIGNYSVLLENCVKDIQITDQMFWSTSALSSFQLQCEEATLEEHAANITNETSTIQSDGTQAVLDTLVLVAKDIALTCPGDCSGYGSCAKGSCVCNVGRTGGDCSLRLDQAPVLKGIYSDGLCNIRKRACKITRVNGYGFINTPHSSLTCHVEGFEAFNQTWNRRVNQSAARLIDLYQVECDLLRHPVSRSGNPYVTGTPVVGMEISVSNDRKKLSNKQTVIVYDGLCLNCTTTGDCVLKNNTCLINGRCYADGDNHPYETAKVCLSNITTEDWTELGGIITPEELGKDTTVIVIGGVVVPFVFLIVTAVALRYWFIGARRGRAEIERPENEEDLFFHY